MIKKPDQHETFQLKRNILLTYIIGSLMWARFFIPVLALFYIASQVPLEQFAIIMAVFAFTTLILEIPTGVVADLLGKKKTLLLSRACYIIEIFLIAFYNGFWVFLIAKIISGIGVSLGSGTESALLYDTLKKINKTEDHKKISGKKSMISNISMAFIFITGSYLFMINPKLPAIISLPFIILGFLLTFLIKEPYVPKRIFTLKNSWKHLKEGMHTFFKNPYLRYLAGFTLLAGTIISIFLSLSSAYFSNILIPASLIGIVAFIGALLAAYTAKKAHTIEHYLGEKRSLFFTQLALIIGIFGMSFLYPYFGILFFFIIPFTQGFYEVLMGDYVNKHIITSHRATMLSINNMFDNIGITFLFPLVGYWIKTTTMSTTFFLFGVFSVACFIILSLLLKPKLTT